MTRQVHLNAFEMNCVGHISHGQWTHPENNRHRYTDLTYWIELAQLLERGMFDAVFLADVVGVYDVYRGGPATAIREAVQIPNNDPLLLVPAMALVTKYLSFAVTVSTTYEHPWGHARRMSTLDHLTNGRVGWNVVTSYLPSAARNYGLDQMIRHDERYEIADEFMDVCYKLWEGSWDDDAVVRDVDRRVYTEPSRVHEINHAGRYFTVPGPHLSEPSPQRTPVLYQAGTSTRGRRFAAKHAEAIFLGAPTVEGMRAHIEDIRRQAAGFGRDPQHVKMFTGLTVVVGRTRAEAAVFNRHRSLEGVLAHYAGSSGFDLSSYDPDEYLDYRETDHQHTAAARYTTGGPRRTVREVIAALDRLDRGYFFAVGTPEEIVDRIEYWTEATGLDGFNVGQLVSPGSFRDFVELVVPELQRRGMLRTAYEGSTFRERLLGPGLGRLPSGHPGARFRRTAAQA